MIEEHPAALAYDWRTRFDLPLSAIGREVGWGEAWRLTSELLTDPSAHITAAIGGWERPFTHVEMALLNTHDVHTAVNHDSKRGKWQPTHRPFEVDDPDTKHLGSTDVPQEDIRAALLARHPGLRLVTDD